MNIKCDYCETNATVNVQRLWVKYPIVKGMYGEPTVVDDFSQDPAGAQDSIHLCGKHYEMWCKAEI